MTSPQWYNHKIILKHWSPIVTKIFALAIVMVTALWAENDPLPQIIERVTPSVVKIKVQRSEPVDDSELVQSDAGGSGFVLISPSYIVSNAHVVKNAQRISVMDYQGNEYPAQIIGKDEITDVAVLYSPLFKSSPLSVSKDFPVRVGDNVFAIGAPYSLDFSVTYGIVSALNRVLHNYPNVRFIQTDAAVNPGNSGGPLFNQNGEVIGVIATFFSKQGGYTNHGFAIPIAKAVEIAQSIIKDRSIQRGSMGADLVLSERIARKMGSPYGIYCAHIDEGRAAHKAGLRSGDLIISVNNKNFTDNGEFHRILESSHPGDKLRITYARNKELNETVVVLDEKSDSIRDNRNNAGTSDAAEKAGLIVDAQTLSVLIAYGDAYNSGIESGDQLLTFNSSRIKNLKDLNESLSKLKEYETATVQVLRRGETLNLIYGQLKKIKGYSSHH